MSDTSLNKIIQYGTTADRIAFTPSPAVGSQVLYLWYDTDNAPNTYVWDGSAWVQINGGPGSAGILKSTVTITDAQIKALPTTPVTVLAAPGAGFYLNVMQVELVAKFSAGAYTNLDTTYSVVNLAINGESQSLNIVKDTTTTPPITSLAHFLGAHTSRVRLPGYLEAVGGGGEEYILTTTADGSFGFDDTANLDNQPLKIQADNNGTGNYTGGNVANTLKVNVLYTVEAV